LAGEEAAPHGPGGGILLRDSSRGGEGVKQEGAPWRQRASTWQKFLQEVNRSTLLRDRARQDLYELWDHVLAEFILALVCKAAPKNRKTQERIYHALWGHFDTLYYTYQEWRLKNPEEEVRKEFLAERPPFRLPALTGKPRTPNATAQLSYARSTYKLLLSQLRLKVKTVRQYDTLHKRKQDMRAALQELAPFRDAHGKLDEALEAKLEGWKREPRERIALEAAAWKYRYTPEYLKRAIPKFSGQMIPWGTLPFMDPEKMLPGEQEILRTYSRLYLHWQLPFLRR